MQRPYNAKKIANCLGAAHALGKDALFIGDSTVREVFWATARKMDAAAAKAQTTKVTEKHADISFTSAATKLDFVWDPFLNSTSLTQTLAAVKTGKIDAASKALVVVGAGLWFAKEEQDAVATFKNTMDAIAEHFDGSQASIKESNKPGHARVLFMPVQPPFYDRLDAEHKTTIAQTEVDQMNKYLDDLTTIHDIKVLKSFLRMTHDIPAAYKENGLHAIDGIADKQAETLLNYKCNNFDHDYPYAGTCCYEYRMDLSQIIVIAVGFVALALFGFAELQGKHAHIVPGDFKADGAAWSGATSHGHMEIVRKHLSTLRPVLLLWAGVYYCYLADRTHLFDKVLKQYNTQDFFVFCTVIGLAGIGTIRKTVVPQRPNQEKPPNQDQPFLSRDQTDEWKGWMQVLILAYHYTGASKVLWIYKIIRLLVASYLFMTGYGHAAYFYQKNDFSLKRVAGVLVRLNLLSCLLPWIMHTDYLFYYFAPLVTYWYAVIYLTMLIKSDWNQKLPLFLGKIAASAALTTFLHTQPQLLAPVFTIINGVFGSRWDAKEWLFRVALDQYIVYIGMVVSVLYIRTTKPPAPPAPPQGGIGATTAHTRIGQSPHLRNTAFFAASAGALAAYAYLQSKGTTKTSSNALHTYISPLPILAFIHLRNSTQALRNHYSTAYAWVGKISLETFILQYHIWLAADTQGLLSLGVFGKGSMDSYVGVLGRGMGLGRWLDCILIGVVFVWVSLKVSNATGAITGMVIKALF